MIDLASIFYILGIAFFVVCFLVLFTLLVLAISLYSKISRLRSQFPLKVISYLKGINSTQLKALGIAIVGYLLSLMKGRVQNSSRKDKIN